MEDTKLAHFKGQNYLNLETFRKNGAGVPTPVWFAESQGILYVRTLAVSAKVKRLRNSGRARVAPCDARGSLLGEWFDAQASLVTDDQLAAQVNQLLNRKYGLAKSAFDLINFLRKTRWTTLAINLNEEPLKT